LKKSPNPVDQHVGRRVRMRRVLVGMSQERLGDALGLTFQQVQKYEKGTNRIGASRLQQIAGVLNVSPAFFFEDMEALEKAQTGQLNEDGSTFVVDFLSTSEGLVLNKNFVRIRDPKIRRKVVELVTSLAQASSE
jgi:transcriptional regulator with XRE-family HTH domain